MKKLDMKKKLEIIYSVTLGINLGESLLLPIILLGTIALAYVNYAVMWTVLAFLLLCWCGTAIVANIIAGLNIQKRWYTAILPFLCLLPVSIFGSQPSYDDILESLAISIGISILTCVLPILFSASRQRKKGASQAKENETILKENNETI